MQFVECAYGRGFQLFAQVVAWPDGAPRYHDDLTGGHRTEPSSLEFDWSRSLGRQ